ncbi:MAG: heparinase II/III family protein, partial [Armatimonadota bacterium]
MSELRIALLYSSQVLILGVLCGSIGLAQMQSAGVSHPVMPVRPPDTEEVAELKSEVDAQLGLGLEKIVNLVPEKNGVARCGCPNCDQGSADKQIIWNGMSDPHGVHCRYCNHRYPSEEYPMDKILSSTNHLGQREEWHYYESPDGKRYFFSARARYWRKWWMAHLLEDISSVYVATGEDRYADAAAQLLYRISQCYAKWVPVTSYAPAPETEPPFPYGRSIWHRWHYRDMEPSVAHAYDRLYESGALERLGANTKEEIEQDMLYPSVDFARSFEETWSNASPTLYRGLVLYGRVLNEPEYVHDGINRAVGLLRKNYLFDGVWRETTVSYHQMTTKTLETVFELARGYSDPEGYINPDDNRRFDDFDVMREFPLFKKAVNVARKLVFPDGHIVPVNDAWARTELSPPEQNGPVLLPAMGHVRLARGDYENAMQTHLHFGTSDGHRHYDALSLILWAHGRELLADIGYTHAAWRMWTIRTASHNTVMVNGWDQRAQPDGNLMLYGPLSENLQVVEAEASGAYADIVSDYRRRVFMVGTSPSRAYLVDIFGVAGGQHHDWILHGSADHDQTASLSPPLQPLEDTMLGAGAQFTLPQNEQDTGEFSGPGIDSHPEGGRRWYRLRGVGYAFMQRVGKAETEGDWSVTFDYADDSDIHLRTTMLGQADTAVYQIKSPSIRRANESDAELPNYYRPGVLVRRTGETDIESRFVAVHESYVGEAHISSVRSLFPSTSEGASAPVALEIEHSDGTDYIISRSVDETGTVELQLADGTLTCDGTVGFLRLRDGRVTAASLVGGTNLAYKDFALS